MCIVQLYATSVIDVRYVQNRFFYFLFGISSVFEKHLDSVWNEFGSVWFKKRGLFRILLLVTTCVIAE